jgi:hypothetical protein
VVNPHLAGFKMELQRQESDGVMTLRAHFSPKGMRLIVR